MRTNHEAMLGESHRSGPQQHEFCHSGLIKDSKYPNTRIHPNIDAFCLVDWKPFRLIKKVVKIFNYSNIP